MKYILTGKQMKEADHFTINEIGIPSLVLMERAAMGVTDCITKQFSSENKVLVACGPGNNGGDGYAIARLLYLKGYNVSILFIGKEASRSKENHLQKQICDYYKIPVVESVYEAAFDVIVDAVFGTGISRDVEGVYADAIDRLNHVNGYKIAVDIPSGIHDGSGKVMNVAFQADLTIAIAYLKRGVVMQPGNAYAGKLAIIDIGINDDVLNINEKLMYSYDLDDLRKRMPKRKPNSHKGSYGKVGLIVGSKGMSGAAYLCAKAAYMTGAGLVQVYTHEDNRVILQTLLPEAIIKTYDTFEPDQLDQFMNWADVIGIGCGLGQSEVSKDILQYVIKNQSKKLLIDADGLNIIAEDTNILKEISCQTVLTPHMKEMSRLLQCGVKELQENRTEKLEDFVTTYPVTCVLKDARTLVAKADEGLYINMTGNASMAKGGSGDVLAGIITGLMAQSDELYQMASLGVFLHGLAGDKAREYKGGFSVSASDLIYAMVDVLKQVD